MADSDDLAEQQLFAELEASAKKAQQAPVNSAVQSAALLNAARIAAAPPSFPSRTSTALGASSPAGMHGRASSGAGKLKRPSFMRDDLAKQPKQNLARRGDPFELLLSPEKAPAEPRKTTNDKAAVYEASPELEVAEPLPGLLEPDVAVEVSPEASPHSPAKGRRLREEVPEMPPRTSGRLAGETVILSDIDVSKVPEHRPHSRKRKSTDRQTESARGFKSPRTGGADVVEANTPGGPAESNHQKQRAKPAHPQVDVPPKPRARLGEQKNPSTRMAEEASVHVENHDDTHAKQLRSRHEPEPHNEITTHGQQEHEEEPPQSAQKPPEQELELRIPQKPKRRKVRQLKPVKVTNSLDISSDKEDNATEHSGPSRRAGHDTDAAGADQPQRPKERRPKARKGSSDRDVESNQEQDTESREVEPKRKRGTPPKASMKPAETDDTPHQEQGNVEPSGRAKQTRSKAKRTATPSTRHSKAAPLENSNSGEQQPSSGDHDTRNVARQQDKMLQNGEDVLNEAAADADETLKSSGGKEEEEHQDQDEGNDVDAQLSDIAKVFKFLDSGKRDGQCQSEDALAIEKACQAALEVFADPETTSGEVYTTTKNLQKLLAKYGKDSEEGQRKALKTDAYAYLFRHVVIHLEALRDWLRDAYPDVESSLDAMRIITSFVNSIVSLKDCIADWKVKVPSRYKGDRLTKDVDINLIVPLRRVEETYCSILRTLKDTARQRCAHDEALQQAREREEAEQRKQEFEEIKRKKQVFWIDLHIHRLQVEHDPWKRQALAMKQEYFDEQMARWTGDQVEGREEWDANGVQFERVDVFKKRVAPPARPSAFIAEREWTDEQMSALVEGLTQFSGPYVFHKIFKEYCRHGRPLRRFGVPEITAKAAEIRSCLLTRFQEQDWKDVPKWIEKIPVLP